MEEILLTEPVQPAGIFSPCHASIFRQRANQQAKKTQLLSQAYSNICQFKNIAGIFSNANTLYCYAATHTFDKNLFKNIVD